MSCTCDICGNPYKIDLTLPDKFWKLVSPTGNSKGNVCGVCIMKKLESFEQYGYMTVNDMVVGDAHEERNRLIKNGTLARYGIGPTSLMLITEGINSPDGNHTYHGIQCRGTRHTAKHNELRPPSKKDLATWEEYTHYREPQKEL